MVNILLKMLAVCGFITLFTVIVLLLFIAIFIVLYTFKEIKKQLNKK